MMPLSLVFTFWFPAVGEAASLAMNTTSSATIPGFVPHVVPSDSDRSIFSIVWSCVATLFACAWVAVHPDMPGLRDKGFDHFFHRIRLLIWVLISPEAVLVWAWRQHRGAQALRYMFNQPSASGLSGSTHWNLSHGHFLQMGGFVLCTNEGDDNTKFIATPAQLKDLSERHIIDFPKELKPDDIEDRSKGDGLTYFVAIGQLLWFVTQCIARTVVGLSITLFELVAVSFAPLTIIMYIQWWRKPQNAQAPIVIVIKQPVELPPKPEKHQSRGKRVLFPLSFIPRAINTFEDMLGTTHRSQSIPHWSRKLPPFYAYPHEHDPSKIPENPLIAGSILGTIFGIIHIIGWNFKFPSRIEKLLWRGSSVIIIVAPLLTVLNVFSARKNLHRKPKGSPPPTVAEKEDDKRDSAFSEADNNLDSQRTSSGHIFHRVWYAFAAAVLALGYIAARLILLGVMCSSLRKLPAKQLQGIDWITDIPHVL